MTAERQAGHAEIEDLITEAAGKLAAASLSLARKTGMPTQAAVGQIEIEARRMLNSISETRKLRDLESGKDGDPQGQTRKCAPAHITTPKVQ